MHVAPLTSEPHFWVKEVILPVGLTLGTSAIVLFGRRAFSIIQNGYRRSALKRAQTQLNFARRLHADASVAQICMSFHAAAAAFPVAACALASGLLAIGYVGSKSLPSGLFLGLGAVTLGLATAQLTTHFFDALFVFRATMLFEELEQKLQRRIARLEK